MSQILRFFSDFCKFYIYNINIYKGISNLIPNEVFFNKTVDLKYIRTFRCVAYYKNFSQNKNKLESNAKKGIFIGINFESHCYTIMVYYDHSIHSVREAVF